jgi:hypothetical protein
MWRSVAVLRGKVDQGHGKARPAGREEERWRDFSANAAGVPDEQLSDVDDS